MITDEMIAAARDAGAVERSAWRIRHSPIVGSNVWFLHDAERDRQPDPATGVLACDATFTEYRCNSREEALSFITQFVWRAGIEAALAVQAMGATKQ